MQIEILDIYISGIYYLTKIQNMKKYVFSILMILLILTSFKSSEDFYTKASYYSKEHQGKRTASSERFNMYALTAAHRTFKFGTLLKITNLRNDKTVIVKINDRGPYIKGRGLDLSYAAFKEIENPSRGVVSIKYNIIN